ncbi:MAG TPA: hypothetical protein VFF69_08225 [Phycisphaerales bacterium]|nr:hypothetical protein [Phycisphaerales bacterium]
MPVQPSRLKVAQQVVGMLLAGILIMALAAVLYVGTGATAPTEGAPGPAQAQTLPRENLAGPLAIVSLAMLALAAGAPLWLARTAQARAREMADRAGGGGDGASEEVMAAYKLYSVKRSLGAAALGVFCAAAAIASGQLWFLAGVAVAAALMIAMFPSRSGQQRFHQRVTGRSLPPRVAAPDLPV